MTKGLQILSILKRVEYTGFTIHLYTYESDAFKYITPIERITSLNVNSIADISEPVYEIYKSSEEIDPIALIKRFTKKKISAKEFFSEENIQVTELVKPFIDTNIGRVVELLIQTGIPLYDSSGLPHLYPIDKIAIEPSPAKTVLRFDRKAEGTIYTLEAFIGKNKINLQDSTNYLISNSPCLLINNRKIIQFEKNITGKIITPFLSKPFIEIPKRLENKYFSSFIKKIVNTSEIKASGFTIHDVPSEPTAVLSLEIDWQGKPCLVLKFKYGEKLFLPESTQRNFTELTSEAEGFTFYRSKRNKSWEDEKKKYLISLGLLQYDNCYRLLNSESLNILYDLVQWLIINRDHLISNGYLINQKIEREFSLLAPQIEQQIKTENDWFDMQIIVAIDGHKIPFSLFRQHILNQKREYILPDGRTFLIPLPWFDEYRDLMIHSESNNGNLKLHKHHYSLLENNNFKGIDEFRKTEDEEILLPQLSNITLRSYQIAGFRWMVQLCNFGFGGILADDMGLGKTAQTIALLSSYYQAHKAHEQKSTPSPLEFNNAKFSNGSHQLDLFESPLPIKAVSTTKPINEIKAASLIVLPASLVHNWFNELDRFAPFLKKLVYTGYGRKKSFSIFKNYQIILTTYGTLRNDIDFLEGYAFAFTILDEGQQIKNAQSQTAQAIFKLNSKNRFVLTGTPVENSLTDLWSQMNFTNPGLLGDSAKFNTFYATPLLKDPEAEQGERLLSIIRPFILRRTKESVAPELPSLTETIQYCTMTDEQSALYESEKSKIRNLVFEQIEKGVASGTPMMVLKALMQLRQIANHPQMIDKQSKAGSGKYEEITDRLETVIAEKHRVLIFSSFVKHLNIIEEYCIARGLNYSLLTGSTSNREKAVSAFKDEDTPIFLISLKAGGVGLNLTEADYVFMLDPWWNPAAEMQAINRAHRIGQFKNVFVYRFITKDSIEEKIMKLQEKKRDLADAFIKPQNVISGMNGTEIMNLFE